MARDEATTIMLDEHIGLRMRARRELAGRTQKEVAEAVGASDAAIQRYEAGKGSVYARVLYQIAGVLNVPVGYFFEEQPAAQETKREADFRRFVHSSPGIQLITKAMTLAPAGLGFLLKTIDALPPPLAAPPED